MKKIGSPKGTIKLWPNNISKEEIDNKGGLKESINKEIEKLYTETKENNEDMTEKDILWKAYKTNLVGDYKVLFNWISFKDEKPIWKFCGNTKDFIYGLQKQVPEIKNISIPEFLPKKIKEKLSKEGNKIGINVFEVKNLHIKKHRELEKPSKVLDKDYGVKNLMRDALDPSTNSKLTDPANQQFQVYLGKKLDRISKIALHIIKTPIDENPTKDSDKKWSVVPDKPSEENKKEGIKYFKTREDATNWIKEQEEKELVASSLNANIMSEWLEPEIAAKKAWELRRKGNKK